MQEKSITLRLFPIRFEKGTSAEAVSCLFADKVIKKILLTKAFANFFDKKSLIPRKREEIKNTRHSSGLGFNAMNINIIEPDGWPDE